MGLPDAYVLSAAAGGKTRGPTARCATPLGSRTARSGTSRDLGSSTDSSFLLDMHLRLIPPAARGGAKNQGCPLTSCREVSHQAL